jgi:competence protein ComGC
MKLHRKKSVTLIELMVTVSILAIGIVGVIRALLTVASALNYSENRVISSQVFESQILKLYELSLEGEDSLETSYGGEVAIDQKTFKWMTNLAPFVYLGEEVEDLKEVDLSVSWQEAGGERKDSIIFYLFARDR